MSSGFPYDERLVQLGISPAEWSEFSDHIVNVTQLTPAENRHSVMAGVGIGIITPLSSSILGLMAGKGPGAAMARRVREKSTYKKVSDSGELKGILAYWNDTRFKPRGFYAALVLPNLNRDGEKSRENRQDLETASTLSGSTASSTSNPKSPKEQAENRYKIALRSYRDDSAVSICSPISPQSQSFGLQNVVFRNTISELPAESRPDPIPEMLADSEVRHIAELP